MAAETDPVIIRIIASQKDLEKTLAASVRATERAAQRMDKALSGAGGGASRNVKQFGKDATQTTQQVSQAAGQLSFQLNDIATSLSGGASPFQVMMQQGSQVTQVMAQIKAQGGSMGQVVVGAFASMLNPVSLISFALIAAAGYAYQYFTAVEEGTKEADKELANHRQALEGIVSKYGDLVNASTKKILLDILDEGKAIEAIKQLNANIEDYKKAATDAVNSTLKEIQVISNPMKKALNDAFPQGYGKIIQDLTAEFSQLQLSIVTGVQPAEKLSALIEHLDALAKEAPYAGFDKMADSLRGIDPALASMMQKLAAVEAIQKKIIENFTKAKNEISGLAQAATALGGPFQGILETIRLWAPEIAKATSAAAGMVLPGVAAFGPTYDQAVVSSPSQAKTYLKGKTKTAEAAKRIDQYEDEYAVLLAKLFSLLPDSAFIESGVRTFDEQYDIHYRRGIRPSAVPGHSRHEQRGSLRPEAADIGGVSADVLQRAVEQAGGLETLSRINDPMHVQRAGEYQKAVSAAADEADRAAEKMRQGQEAYEDYIEAQKKSLGVAQENTKTLQDGSLSLEERKIAIEANTLAQQMNDQATKNGITLTDQLKASHLALATAIVRQKHATEEITKAQQEAQQAQQQFAQQIGGIAQSAVSGFVNDLRNGVSAAEAFTNALDRVIDGLINMAIQALFSKQALGALMPGAAGGGGSIMDVILGTAARGGTVGRNMRGGQAAIDPRVFAGAKRYATGGRVLKPGEVPIIAHHGEVVIPASMVRKASGSGGGKGSGGSVHNNIGDINVDMSKSGLVASSTEDGKALGQQIQAAVQVVLVKESRPGGILRKVPA
jgi:hypothetical protein